MFVLKNEVGKYVSAANAHLHVNRRTGQAQMLSKPDLVFTNDITKAQLLEKPNFDKIKEYNLFAVKVIADKPKIKEVGNVYEMAK